MDLPGMQPPEPPGWVCWLRRVRLLAWAVLGGMLLVGGVVLVRGQVADPGADAFTVSDPGEVAPAQVDQPDLGDDGVRVELEGRLLGSQETWSSAQSRGSVLVVNFWASWCVPCREEQAGLNRVAVAYQGKDVQFIGVNIQDTEDSARAYQREFDIPYPSLFDPRSQQPAAKLVGAIPTTLIVDRDGTLRYRLLGAQTPEDLSARIDTVLAPERSPDVHPPTPPDTTAAGL